MLLFVDGFDYYPTADLPKKWASLIPDWQSASPSIVQQGRFGTNTGALQLGGAGTAGLTKTITSNSIIIGFALKSTNANPGAIVTLTNTSDGQVQASIALINGVLSYKNGSRNSYSASSNTAVITNTWNYIEVKVTLQASATAGATQIRLNGVVVIDVPVGTNTIGDFIYNTPTFNRLQLCGDSGSSYLQNVVTLLDDLYIADNTTANNNNFLGDIRIETLFPNGPGDSTQFTATTGANWSCVSETPEDGDASYVSGNTPSLLDLYSLADLSSNPTAVHGVQISTIGRKNDAGSRLVSPVLKSGTTNFDHSATNPYGLADGYTQHLDLWELDPNGNIAWTGASINALQLGLKVVS